MGNSSHLQKQASHKQAAQDQNTQHLNSMGLRSEKTGNHDEGKALTFRIVLLASIWLIVLARINWLGMSRAIPAIDTALAPSPVALAIMLLVIFLNTLSIRFFSRKAERMGWFSQGEIFLLYNMVMTGGVLVSTRVIWFVIQIVGIPTNAMFDSAMWTPHLEQISPLVLVTDAQDIMGFWMGSGDVPWSSWVIPLILWGLFWVTLLFTIMCTVSMVYTQWADRERLLFPLTSPVVSMVGQTSEEEELSSHDYISFWKNKLVYIGLSVPFVFYSSHIINDFIPVFPQISGTIFDPQELVNGSEPFSQSVNIHVSLRQWKFDPMQWGIAYLMHLEMSFSIWFVALVFFIWRYFVAQIGHISYYQSTLYDPVSLGLGATVGIAIASLWMGRYHLKKILHKAIGSTNKPTQTTQSTRLTQSSEPTHSSEPTQSSSSNQSLGSSRQIDDSNEPLPFKVAFWGFIASFIFLTIFTVAFLRVGLITTISYFIIFSMCILTTARFRAQSGIPLLNATGDYWFSRSIFIAVGGDKEYALSSTGIMHYGPLEYGAVNMVGANLIESYKFSDIVGFNKRHTAIGVFIALIIAVISMMVIGVITSYENGANMYSTLNVNAGTMMHHANMTLNLPDGGFRGSLVISRWIWYSVGLGAVLIMSALMTKFAWWPIHPLGILLGTHHYTWGLSWHWSIFSIWIIKAIIRRAGGYQLERTLRPFFIAMISGSALMTLLHSVLNVLISLT